MKDLVTAAEFAASLNRPPRSIYDARHRGGDLPVAITIGGRLYFAQDDIDTWISDKRDASRAELEERQFAINRHRSSAAAKGSTRPQTRRERPAFHGNGRSLSDIAFSKDMSNG